MNVSAADPRSTSDLKISEIILKTGGIEAMKAWYATVLGLGPFFEHQPATAGRPGDYGGQTRASDLHMCFFRLSIDYPNTQVIGIFQEPGVLPSSEKDRPGLHHMQLMARDLDHLCERYEQLRELGMRPHRSADHGPMTSFYYRDPDGNNVELTAQNFPTLDAMIEFMSSDVFKANPSGRELDPEDYVAAWRAGRRKGAEGQ